MLADTLPIKNLKIVQINRNPMWDRFWEWYDKHTTENLLVMAIIVYIQIPHMVWAGDLYLQLGQLSRINPVLDFVFYGVDLIEIVLMVKVSMMIYGRVKKKNANKQTKI